MKELIEILEDSNLSEISIEEEDFKITLKKNYSKSENSGKSPSSIEIKDLIKQAAPEEQGSGNSPEPASKTQAYLHITSPIVGTFYRSSSPDSPPYVEIGDLVEKGQTVCIVEAMKVMNEVKSDYNGQIVEVLVEEGETVEYGQELFLIEPKTNNRGD